MKKKNASGIEILKYKMLLVGMVNVLVLSALSGIQGAGYLGISLMVLTLLISFHSVWVSDMVARYIRGRNARNQYRSSLKFFRGALLYISVTGILLGVVLVLCSDLLGSFLIRDIHISICLMILAALLPAYGISEAFSGYLRGMGFYMPVKLFYVVRQAAAFVGSIAGMKFLGEYGKKVANLKHNEAVTSVYDAFGALLGMTAGSILGIVLLLAFCVILRGELRSMRSKDNARYQESASHGFRVMISMGFLYGFRCLLLFAPLPVNYILYVRLCKSGGDSAPWIRTGGYLFGEAIPVMAMLLLSFVILNHRNYRQLAGYWKSEAYSQFREKVFAMLLSVFTLIFPFCAAVAVMAEPILKCLTKGADKEGTSMLLFLSVGAVLLVLERIAHKLMELWGEMIYLYLTVVVCFVVQTAFAAAAFKVLDLGVKGIVFGMFLQAALFLLLFLVKFARRLRISGYQVKKLIMGIIVALAGALIMLLIYKIIGEKLSAGAAVAVSVVPGFLLYLAVVVLLQIISDREAEFMPGGELFLRLNRLFRR